MVTGDVNVRILTWGIATGDVDVRILSWGIATGDVDMEPSHGVS